MSTQRSFAVLKTLPTNIVTPNVITYEDTNNDYLPIPFTVKNGVLDIAVQDDVTALLLTASTFTYIDSNNVQYQGSILGGLSLVTSLGPNMLIFLKNFINWNYDTAINDLTEDITMHTAPTMTKLSFNDLESDDTYTFSNKEPIVSGFELVSRRPNNVAWIFKSPLVIKFKYDGDVNYLTLVSAVDSA